MWVDTVLAFHTSTSKAAGEGARPILCLLQRLQIENQRQHVAQDAIRAVRIGAVLVAIVVAIFVAALKALAEIVVVVRLVHVISVVAEVRILIGKTVLVVRAPTVLAVGRAGAEAFLVAVIYRLPQRVRSVLVDFVVRATAIVAIDRGGIEVRIVVVIVTFATEAILLLSHTLVIFLLEAVLGHAPLLLQGRGSLLRNALLLVQVLAVFHDPLLLLSNQLLLPLL